MTRNSVHVLIKECLKIHICCVVTIMPESYDEKQSLESLKSTSYQNVKEQLLALFHVFVKLKNLVSIKFSDITTKLLSVLSKYFY